MAEIEAERRGGYHWYVDEPHRLLEKEYPVWARKWPAPTEGVAEFSLATAEARVREKYPDITRPSADLPKGVVAAENLTYAEVDGQVLQLDLYGPRASPLTRSSSSCTAVAGKRVRATWSGRSRSNWRRAATSRCRFPTGWANAGGSRRH